VAKNPDEMVQTTFRLSRSLMERVQKAGGDRGVAEEIRARLERSFLFEADPFTNEFVHQAAALAREINDRFEGGGWASDRFAYETFKLGLSKLLGVGPRGEPIPHPKAEEWEMAGFVNRAAAPRASPFNEKTTPEEAAAFLAFLVLNARRR
jgi:hypothetical protein